MKPKYKYFLSKESAIRFRGMAGFWQGHRLSLGKETKLPFKYFVSSPNWRPVKRHEYLWFIRQKLALCKCAECKKLRKTPPAPEPQVASHDYYGEY